MKSEVISAGHAAAESLKTARSAQTLTQTSNGLFLLTDKNEILFLTSARQRGPLTINVDRKLPENADMKPGCIFQIHPECIWSRAARMEFIFTSRTSIWQPGLSPIEGIDSTLFFTRCKMLKSFIPPLFSSGQGQVRPGEQMGNLEELLSFRKNEVSQKLKSREPSGFTAAAKNLAGFGEGLTPAGDDFLCGLLLANHYCGDHFKAAPEIRAALAEIPRTCGPLTTLLSRNLLRCAAQGSADERILNCLQWIMRNEGNPEVLIEELRTYGSSSGQETLAGFLCFVEAFSREDQSSFSTRP